MSEEERSDEDYCEELDVALDLDLSRSSKICPLPKKAGSPATDPPATDPPSRSNEPSCRHPGQRSMLAWFSRAGAQKSTPSAKETAKKRRDTQRQTDVEQAAAAPKAPTRAKQIEKQRRIRLHKDRRKTKGEGLEEEEEEEEGEEGEEEEVGVGTKHKLKKAKKGW